MIERKTYIRTVRRGRVILDGVTYRPYMPQYDGSLEARRLVFTVDRTRTEPELFLWGPLTIILAWRIMARFRAERDEMDELIRRRGRRLRRQDVRRGANLIRRIDKAMQAEGLVCETRARIGSIWKDCEWWKAEASEWWPKCWKAEWR